MFPSFELLGIEISMYALCMAAGLILASAISVVRIKKRRLSVTNALIMIAAAFLAGIIGAKLLFVFVTYDIRTIVEAVLRADYHFFLNSGLVYYGGLIAGIGGAALAAKRIGVNFAEYTDAAIPTLPLAHALGRVGCFCAGCCYGMEYHGCLAVRFPELGGVETLPIQLIEAAGNVALFVFLMLLTRRRRHGYTTLFAYLGLYSMERFILEFFRGDDIRGMFGGLSTSQWISIGIFVSAAIYFIAYIRDRACGNIIDVPEQEHIVPAEDDDS